MSMHQWKKFITVFITDYGISHDLKRRGSGFTPNIWIWNLIEQGITLYYTKKILIKFCWNSLTRSKIIVSKDETHRQTDEQADGIFLLVLSYKTYKTWESIKRFFFIWLQYLLSLHTLYIKRKNKNNRILWEIQYVEFVSMRILQYFENQIFDRWFSETKRRIRFLSTILWYNSDTSSRMRLSFD